MSRELVSFDYAMKYILRQKTNFDILEGFLEALLKEEITIIDILESESTKDRDESKLSRVDLMAKDSNDRRLIIEIQYDREDDYLESLKHVLSMFNSTPLLLFYPVTPLQLSLLWLFPSGLSFCTTSNKNISSGLCSLKRWRMTLLMLPDLHLRRNPAKYI